MKEFFDRMDSQFDHLAGYVEWWMVVIFLLLLFIGWLYLEAVRNGIKETCESCGKVFDPATEGTVFSEIKRMSLCGKCTLG